MKKYIKIVKILILALAISVGASLANAQWNPAPGTPPSPNAAAPLNVGSSAQDKIGKLNLLGGWTSKGWNSIGNTSSTVDPQGGDSRAAVVFGATDTGNSWYLGSVFPGQANTTNTLGLFQWGFNAFVQQWYPSGQTSINLSQNVAPIATLDVNGTVAIRGGSPAAGKVLTSDSQGLTSWQTPAGGGGGGSPLNWVMWHEASYWDAGSSVNDDNGISINYQGQQALCPDGEVMVGIARARDSNGDTEYVRPICAPFK